MSISMSSTHFISLPDIVLLEIFGYLSCEDVLYAFADLHDTHLIDLLIEHGSFRHICLSSQLSCHQYKILSQGSWRYDLVRSLVCKEMFSDFISDLAPCKIFSSLTDLRILSLRCPSECLSEFVIAHSSTLTYFTVMRSELSFQMEGYRTFLHSVLPHLSQLRLLDTDWRSYVSIDWSSLAGRLKSLEHLFTFMDSMSDVYALAVDGFSPCLRCLHVHINNAVIKSVLRELSTTTNFHMSQLETFDLYLNWREEDEDEEQIEWTVVETLTSKSVMPRLRQCSVVYKLTTNIEIRHMFQSPFFKNDERNIRIRFVLCFNTSIFIDSSDIANISDIRSVSSNEIFLKHNNEDNSKLYLTWFSQSWPSWTTFWMYHRDVAPRNGVRELGITASNTSLHSIGKLFPNVKELMCTYPASLSMADSSLAPTPLVNVLHLTVLDVVPGLELLLDGIMLPRLRSIRGMIVPLFVTLARRTNQMRTLDTIDHLEITDQNNGDERSFSFKQWYMLLDAVPRLRTLLFQFHNAKCPPIALADLFIDYIRRTIRTPLTLFSCCIDDVNDINSKEHFITRLEEGINMVRPSIQFASISSTRLYAW
ncbi:unnamed protein product, partial [Rotaria socialis]